MLINGSVLRSGETTPSPATVVWREGLIERIDDDRSSKDDVVDRSVGPDRDLPVFDAGGALVLPGIVDVHGDAFERCLMPRSGVPVDVDLALADNDGQLLASGITTSFLSATDSWEPGLRSRDTLRTLVEGLNRRRGGPDVLLHVRHERCNTENLDELIGWIDGGQVALFSYNDHTTEKFSATQVQRSGVSAEEFHELSALAVSRRELGLEQEKLLSAAADRAGCVTASHDASQEEHLDRDLNRGVGIAEFPLSIALAKQYQAENIPVLLGAPNLVRGASHIGNLSVRDALAADAGDLLCSDYHYPSLFQAPFVAAEEGLCSFADAWDLVSAGPAAAAGLTDRGRLEPGARADLIVVGSSPAPARVELAVVGGERVLATR